MRYRRDMMAEESTVLRTSDKQCKKLLIIRMISLLLHNHHLVYCLIVYNLQKAENIICKAQDMQH